MARISGLEPARVGRIRIKACKYCGGEGILQELYVITVENKCLKKYFVQCNNCGYRIEAQRNKTEAMKKWNEGAQDESNQDNN